jgi:hypothetical protein
MSLKQQEITNLFWKQHDDSLLADAEAKKTIIDEKHEALIDAKTLEEMKEWIQEHLL